MATKKVGPMGKYGPRYGTRTKKIGGAIERKQRQKQECPYCERQSLKRVAVGIWQCRKCGVKFAGGAYLPKSPVKTILKEEAREDV